MLTRISLLSIQGLVPLIIEEEIVGDEVRTDLAAVEAAIKDDPESIVCIYSTTSCFAPRVPDSWVIAERGPMRSSPTKRLRCSHRLPELALLASKYNIGHLINNAYGVQSSKCMHLISEACRIGRVDMWVQSTDKNFMVPIGGAVVCGTDNGLVESVGKLYPGTFAYAKAVLEF